MEILVKHGKDMGFADKTNRKQENMDKHKKCKIIENE